MFLHIRVCLCNLVTYSKWIRLVVSEAGERLITAANEYTPSTPDQKSPHTIRKRPTGHDWTAAMAVAKKYDFFATIIATAHVLASVQSESLFVFLQWF